MGQAVGRGELKVDGDHQLPLRGWRVLLSRWVMERAALLNRSEQADEQELRAAVGDWRSLHLHCDEPPDGQEIGSLSEAFQEATRRAFSEVGGVPATLPERGFAICVILCT